LIGERREEESVEQKATLSAPAKTAQNALANPPATATKASELGIPAMLGPDLYRSIESEGLLKDSTCWQSYLLQYECSVVSERA
jgi:hypothetical protein